MKVFFFALLVMPFAYAYDNNQHTYDILQLKNSQQEMTSDHQRTCEMLIQTCLGRKGLADLQAEEAENEREVYFVENATETDETFEEKEAPYRGRKKSVR